jgi:hypothetical protein
VFGSILTILAAGLSIWESKEKTKYIDKMLGLKKDYYEEFNKGPELRDHAQLDRIEYELRVLGETWAASVGKPDPVA